MRAGLELKDGGTDFSPDIGTFCHNTNGQDRPPTQKSSSNVMRIKYYTNEERPNLGFKAKLSIGKVKYHFRIPLLDGKWAKSQQNLFFDCKLAQGPSMTEVLIFRVQTFNALGV